MAPDRQRFCQQLERDLDRCYQDLSFFRDYDSNHPLSANPSIYSPAERRLAQDRTQNTEDSADMRYPSMIAAQSPRRKKWNVSKEDWLILQEANRNFPHDREEYLRQHPYDPRLDNYEPPRISFGEDGHLRYDSNYQ